MPKRQVSDFDEGTSPEPEYIPAGEEFGSTDKNKRPKWMIASTPFQKLFLSTVNRTYYQTHDERSAVLAIEKSMMSLETGVISVYPKEWVDNCFEWVNRKRREGSPIALIALVNLINNSDRRAMFVTDWKRKHPDIAVRNNIEDEMAKIETPVLEDESRLDAISASSDESHLDS